MKTITKYTAAFVVAATAAAAIVTVQTARTADASQPGFVTEIDGDDMLVDGFVTGGTYALVDPASIAPLTAETATVQVEDVVWQTAFGGEEWKPVDDGQTVVAVSPETGIWTEAAGIASANGNLILGLTSGGEPGTYALTFGIELVPGNPELLGEAGASYTPDLQAFLQWQGNAFGACTGLPTDCVQDFLIAWNLEVNQDPPAIESPAGPISISFAQYWEKVVNGTLSWQQLPPDRRSIQDAPEAVRSALTYADVWVYVPESWKTFQDGAICLRISQGSDGCMHVSSAGAGHLVNLDGWTVVDEPITIEVRPLDQGSTEPMATWDGQVSIGKIPYEEVLKTGIVLVTLDPNNPPISYLALQANPPASPMATVEAIPQQQLFELLDQEPIPAAEPCGLTCN